MRPSLWHSRTLNTVTTTRQRNALTKYTDTNWVTFSYSCFHVIVLLIVWEVAEEEKQWEGGKLFRNH